MTVHNCIDRGSYIGLLRGRVLYGRKFSPQGLVSFSAQGMVSLVGQGQSWGFRAKLCFFHWSLFYSIFRAKANFAGSGFFGSRFRDKVSFTGSGFRVRIFRDWLGLCFSLSGAELALVSGLNLCFFP